MPISDSIKQAFSEARDNALSVSSNVVATGGFQKLVIFGLILLLLVLGIIHATLYPLKETVTRVAILDAEGRQVAVASSEPVAPSERVLNFFLRRWLNDAFEVSSLSEPQIKRAYRMTSGGATARFNEWFQAERHLVLAKEGRTRILSTLQTPTFVSKNVAVINFSSTTRSSVDQGAGVVVNWTATVTYQIVDINSVIASDEDKRLMREENPLGLFVTQFDFQKS
jgi:type IV secretory pathway component VirB8